MADDEREVMWKVEPIAQAKTVTCWLACYRMLYKHKKKSERELFKRLAKAKIPTDEALDITQWGRAAGALGLSGKPVKTLRASFDNLFEALEIHSPIWCAGNFLPGNVSAKGHAVLLIGASEKESRKGDDRYRVTFIDPLEIWRGNDKVVRTYEYWKKAIKQTTFACQVWW